MSDTCTLLLIESDLVYAGILASALRNQGYAVVHAVDSVEGLNIARTDDPDAIIIDADQPGIDGITLCGIIRKRSPVPIVVLVAGTGEHQRIRALDMGADLCLLKLVSLAELDARIRSLLRSYDRIVLPQQLVVGDLRLDTHQRRAWLSGQALHLTLKEFDLLAYLMRNRGVVLPREQLVKDVWGIPVARGKQTLEVHICWLRQKVEPNPKQPRYIQTVRKIGYRFNEP